MECWTRLSSENLLHRILAILSSLDREDSRSVLVQVIPKHHCGLPPEERLKSCYPRHRGDRKRMFCKLKRIGTLGDKTDILRTQKFAVECNITTAPIRILCKLI